MRSPSKQSKPGEPKPFSLRDCIWRPSQAVDPELCKPFATLQVTIERAFGLVAADVTTSDPYCKLLVNGIETGFSTQEVRATLAPVWNQAFEIPIYHPQDIFTITVYDKDFGTSLGELDVLGLDDDFLGWVDFPVVKLPHNKSVHGWFALSPEHHFSDSLAGRKRKAFVQNGHQSAGHLHLSMTLSILHPRDEAFALMLPVPHCGEDLPSLDMVSIFDTYTELKAEERLWHEAFMRLYLAFPKDPWVDTAVAVFLVWTPKFLPCIICFGSACLTWKAWLDAVRKKRDENPGGLALHMAMSATEAITKTHRAAQEHAKVRRERMNLFLPRCCKRKARPGGSCGCVPSNTNAQLAALERKRENDTKLGIREPLLNGVSSAEILNGVSPSEIVALAPKATPQPCESPRSLRNPGLTTVQVRSLRYTRTEEEEKEDQATHELGTKLEMVQPFIRGKERVEMRKIQKVLADVTEHVGAIQDFVAEDHNLFTMALGLTVSTIVLFVLHTWIGVILQVGLTLVIIVALLSDTVIGRFLHAACAWSSIVVRRHQLHFHIALGKTESGSHHVHKELSRHMTALHMEPHEPSEHVFHARGHAHELVKKNYVEPTWCYGCGGFLWGISYQGYQCRWCYRNVCKACAEHARDTETGPRDCDVDRPPGWEETASIFSESTCMSSTNQFESYRGK
jgi:hypothetical protein